MKRLMAVVTVLMISIGVCFANGKAESKSPQPTKLVFWNISATDVLRPIYKQALADFAAKYPNIQVESVPFEPNSYQQTKVPTAVAANELPDMMYFWGGSNVQPFISKLVPLNDYLGELKAQILPGTTAKSTFDGKTYGLPVQMWVGTMFVNKKLFEQYNVKIPTTFSEMDAAVKTFAKNGVLPWIAGGQDAWTLGFYIEASIVKTAGIQKYHDAAVGKISWGDPEIRKGLEFALTNIKAGAFGSSILAVNRDESEVTFKSGKGAMYYNGSWVAGGLDPATYAAVPFPYNADAPSHKNEIVAATNDYFYVVNGPKKDAAITATKFLAEDVNKLAYEAGTSLPTYRYSSPADTSKVSVLLKDIAAFASDATASSNGSAWDFDGVSRTTAQKYYEIMQAFAANKLSVDQFVQESDAAAKLK